MSKYPHLFLFIVIPVAILCVRIPPNPCKSIFNYYKDSKGNIYGSARIPYDNGTALDFSVNTSIVGVFPKGQVKLKIELVTKSRDLYHFTKNVVYNIYFPFSDPIPKITAISFNGRTYCRGPGEPVIPGEPGITSTWNAHFYKFERFDYGPNTNEGDSIMDDDLEIKDPHESAGRYPSYSPTRHNTLKPILQRPKIPEPIQPKPIPAPNPPTITDDPSLDDDIDKLFTQHNKPSNTNPTNSASQCGLESEEEPSKIVPFIIGGDNTYNGQYPWLVAFFWKFRNNYHYKCNANLISNRHVITAGRCLQSGVFQIVKTEDILLVMGTNNLENWNQNAIKRYAKRVDVTSEFKANSESAHGDLAIITLGESVLFSAVLRPICLWTGNNDISPLENHKGIIAGFGKDEDSNKNGLTHVLIAKRATLPIVPQKECLYSTRSFTKLVSYATFCTRNTAGSGSVSGPCIGDNGAGFSLKMNGIHYLRGVASNITSSNGVCDLTSEPYSVFCDVAKFATWIDTIIKDK